MEERDFGRYLLLLVAVVAVVGLLVGSGDGITGFAAKKARLPGKVFLGAGVKANPNACVYNLATGRKRCDINDFTNRPYVAEEFTCSSDKSKIAWRAAQEQCVGIEGCRNGECVTGYCDNFHLWAFDENGDPRDTGSCLSVRVRDADGVRGWSSRRGTCVTGDNSAFCAACGMRTCLFPSQERGGRGGIDYIDADLACSPGLIDAGVAPCSQDVNY